MMYQARVEIMVDTDRDEDDLALFFEGLTARLPRVMVSDVLVVAV